MQIDPWGGDRTLEGTVRLIEPSAFTKVSALSVEEQRVNVIVDLTDPLEQRTGLGDAFRVEAHIVTWRGNDVLRVPSSSLFRSGDERNVFVVRDGIALAVIVKTDHRNSLEVEIVSGLSIGEEIVLYPGDRVRSGVEIERRH